MDFLTPQQCQTLPKVVLHDHLDGSLRPETVHRIRKELGLPTPWGDALQPGWFASQMQAHSLPAYLDGFKYTLECMQRTEDLKTVAFEACMDLADDNVRYAELRFAPLLCTNAGLAPEAVVESVLEGIEQAQRQRNIHVQLLLCVMRQADSAHSMRVVELAKTYLNRGVAGIDLAGPEEGFPPRTHQKSFQKAHDAGVPITVHAGETCGIESIAIAVNDHFAQRLGHGIRILDAMPGNGVLPDLMWDILERNITLEVCPSSNVMVGAVESLQAHPWLILDRLHLPITLNTDNRLISNITTSQEWAHASKAFDFMVESAVRHTSTAIESAFTTDSVKKELRAGLKDWNALQTMTPETTNDYSA